MEQNTREVKCMTQYTRNILKVYKQCTEEEIAHGMKWYADAKS